MRFHSKHARAALVVLSLAASLGATAAPSDLDAQAREALRNGQFRHTIDLTSEITRTDPLSTLNWYRLAIAADKERDFALAARALYTAERLDPSLSFASSPERVQALKSSIAAGGGVFVAPAPGKATGADEAAPTRAPERAEAFAPENKVLAAIAALEREVRARPQPDASVGLGVFGMESSWVVGFIALALCVLTALLVALQRAAARLIRLRKVNVATMPLDDLIVHCRDELALLQQRLDYHGHQDTEIAAMLGRLQPAFARECGKSRIALEPLKDDRPLADVKAQLPARVPALGNLSAAQVHKDAVQQALQQARQQRRA